MGWLTEVCIGDSEGYRSMSEVQTIKNWGSVCGQSEDPFSMKRILFSRENQNWHLVLLSPHWANQLDVPFLAQPPPSHNHAPCKPFRTTTQIQMSTAFHGNSHIQMDQAWLRKDTVSRCPLPHPHPVQHPSFCLWEDLLSWREPTDQNSLNKPWHHTVPGIQRNICFWLFRDPACGVMSS